MTRPKPKAVVEHVISAIDQALRATVTKAQVVVWLYDKRICRLSVAKIQAAANAHGYVAEQVRAALLRAAE